MKLIKIFATITLLFLTSCSYFKHSDQKQITSLPIGESQHQEQEKEYIAGTDDIPLFNNLELIEDDSSSFDTMVGTITISKYSSDSTIKLVKNFYVEALPQLGWKLTENTSNLASFKRENDTLEIRFSRSPENLYVRFFISSILQ
jgi:hypothetical protein